MTSTPISYIMAGKEGKGVNRYMLEEVYFSQSAREGDRDTPNPQNCYYDESTGRWYYDYPAMWYNNISGNKAIGLRKIDCYAPSVFIRFTPTVYYKINNDWVPTTVTFAKRYDGTIPTREIAAEICQWWNAMFSKLGREYPQLDIFYSDDKKELIWDFTISVQPSVEWRLELANMSNGMMEWLNGGFNTTTVNRIPGQIKAKNVWNREFLFLHASFVNATSFNYLGRAGEFYPKPSKMYQAAPSSQQFYFQISFDGRTPVKYKPVNFIVDLCYIYYDKGYKAQ